VALAQFQGSEGIVFVGKAQEKTPVFRTEKRRNPDTGQAYYYFVSWRKTVHLCSQSDRPACGKTRCFQRRAERNEPFFAN